MKTRITITESGSSVGAVTVEDGDVSVQSDELDDDQRAAIRRVSDYMTMTGGREVTRQIPGNEPVTNPERVTEASHEERVQEVLTRLRSMGYAANRGE